MMEEKILNNLNYKKFTPDWEVMDTILILHWWWWTSESWVKMWVILSDAWYKVYVPDIPWFWKTPLDKVYTLDTYADKIISFAKRLKLKNFILWWHSNWWAISIKIVNKNELEIKALVLNNSAWIRADEPRELKRKVYRQVVRPFRFAKNTKLWRKARNVFYKAIWSSDYVESEEMPYKKETYLNMIWEDLQDEMKKISIPTLLIRGENDTYTPPRDWEQMSKLIKWSRLVVLSNEKHWIHLQNPNALFRSFVYNIKILIH